jgi:hypothetical protein
MLVSFFHIITDHPLGGFENIVLGVFQENYPKCKQLPISAVSVRSMEPNK